MQENTMLKKIFDEIFYFFEAIYYVFCIEAKERYLVFDQQKQDCTFNCL